MSTVYIGVSHPIGASHPIGDRKDPVGTGSHIGARKDRSGTRSHIGASHQEDNECTEPRIARRLDDHAAAPAGETTTTQATVRHIFSVFSAEMLVMLKKIATSTVNQVDNRTHDDEPTTVIVARTAGRQMSLCCLAVEHYQGHIRTHLIYRN